MYVPILYLFVDKVYGSIPEERDLESELSIVHMASGMHHVPLHCETLTCTHMYTHTHTRVVIREDSHHFNFQYVCLFSCEKKPLESGIVFIKLLFLCALLR